MHDPSSKIQVTLMGIRKRIGEFRRCPFWCFIVFLLLSEIVGLVYRKVILRMVENKPATELFGIITISSKHLQILIGILLVVLVLWFYSGLCGFVSKRKAAREKSRIISG